MPATRPVTVRTGTSVQTWTQHWPGLEAARWARGVSCCCSCCVCLYVCVCVCVCVDMCSVLANCRNDRVAVEMPSGHEVCRGRVRCWVYIGAAGGPQRCTAPEERVLQGRTP